MTLGLALFISLFFYEQADFIIVQFPQKLVIYNKYQQLIEKNELVKFRENSAFKILERNMQFNDQINFGMKVEYEGEPYYFGKNEKGHLLRLDEAGKIDVLERAEAINKRIELLKSYQGQSLSQQRKVLKSGTLVSGIFKKANRYYVQNETGTYFWLSLNQSLKSKSWDWYVPDPTIERHKKLLSDLEGFADRYSAKLKNSLSKMSVDEQQKIGNVDIQVVNHSDSITLNLVSGSQVFSNSIRSIYREMIDRFSDVANISENKSQLIFKAKLVQ